MSVTTSSDETLDFALSYAGEDVEVARAVAERLRELTFTVFLADEQRRKLVGVDGETFFEQLFMEAKQVVPFISRHYRSKEWTQFEWEIIRKRGHTNRYVPVRLDDTSILGLPSKVLYISWTGDNFDDVVDTYVERLLHESRPLLWSMVVSQLHGTRRGRAFKLC